ncbi:TIGR02444 family protein [Oceaniserpentilla sp. 4NH20-0058]|uniref:TIGR02444 family protein n=1 Tax=Oceaniserpentilla sp. 4NH20-0058 TaxID=3127660 RepID=UPI00333E8A3C
MDNPFWHYSLKQYSNPACASFLLDAQDNYGLDINILLFIGWLSTHKPSLISISHLNSAMKWNQRVIQPIRWFRRKIKILNVIKAYNWIKKQELWAEQVEQAMLFLSSQELAQFNETGYENFEMNIQVYLKGKIVIEETWLQALFKHLQPK